MEDVHNKKKTSFATIADLLTFISSSILHQSPSATSPHHLLLLLRHVLLLFLRLLLYPLLLLLSPRAHPKTPSGPPSYSPDPTTTSSQPAARALTHVLSVVSSVPVSSRKYDLIRSLADCLLDDNIKFSAFSLNRAALAAAFARTIRQLQRAHSSPVETVRSTVKRLLGMEEEVEWLGEKMAAEALWLAKRMAECGAGMEAVEMWGEAVGLARMGMTVETRIQAGLVRVSAFLFKEANKKQHRKEGEANDCSKECAASRSQLAMLISWLPLLCQATNGIEAQVLSSSERADVVKVLEEMIKKLTWNEQEAVLAIWLHHFTANPDSDWPNLESCYTLWYSESRKLLLQ